MTPVPGGVKIFPIIKRDQNNIEHMKGSNTGDDLKNGMEPPEYSQIKIDADSARILHYLNNLDTAEYATSRELLEATNLSNTTQVCYRLDEHLIPGGLACERPYAEVEGHNEGDEWHGPREFMASAWTQHWVEQHGSSPLPVTEEVQQARRDLERQIGSIEQRVDEVVSSVEQIDEQLEALSGRIGGVKSQQREQSGRLDDVEARIDEVAGDDEIAEQVEEVEQAVGQLSGRLDQVESLLGEQDALRERIESLRGDLDDVSRAMTDRNNRLDSRVQSLEDAQSELSDRLDEQQAEIEKSPWWRWWA